METPKLPWRRYSEQTPRPEPVIVIDCDGFSDRVDYDEELDMWLFEKGNVSTPFRWRPETLWIYEEELVASSPFNQ